MKLTLCVGVATLLTAATCWGQTITETFEGGIPASWSIVDNHFLTPGVPDFSAVPWTTNLAEGMLNYTGGGGATGAGTAATASSANHPGQYDVSLITPTFLINAGPGGNSLAYTINYQFTDAFEWFDTNLSINGGPWIVMNHQHSDEGPFFSTGPPKVSHAFSLGFFGAVPGDTARVEFRYYSTFLLPMVHNLYVQIDDVRTPTFVPEPIAPGALLVLGVLASRGRRRVAKRQAKGGPRRGISATAGGLRRRLGW